MMAGGVTGVHSGRKAAEAVRVTTSPFGMDRIPPTGRLRAPQLRPLDTNGASVGTGPALPGNSCRASMTLIEGGLPPSFCYCPISMELIPRMKQSSSRRRKAVGAQRRVVSSSGGGEATQPRGWQVRSSSGLVASRWYYRCLGIDELTIRMPSRCLAWGRRSQRGLGAERCSQSGIDGWAWRAGEGKKTQRQRCCLWRLKRRLVVSGVKSVDFVVALSSCLNGRSRRRLNF